MLTEQAVAQRVRKIDRNGYHKKVADLYVKLSNATYCLIYTCTLCTPLYDKSNELIRVGKKPKSLVKVGPLPPYMLYNTCLSDYKKT